MSKVRNTESKAVSPLQSAADSGVQAVARAAELLRLVSRSGHDGARLLDLAEAAGLHRPTAHRLLRSLCAEKLIEQDDDSKRYRLGVALYELGLAAPSPLRRLDRIRPRLRELALATGDTVYLVMRSEAEAVCVAFEEGGFPIRTRTFELGARRPLGLGAAGLALMAALPPDQIEAALQRNRRALRQYGLTAERLRERIAQTQRLGIALSEGTITEGVTGIGVTVPCLGATPYLAVSVAAISARIAGDRVQELRRELVSVANRVGQIEQGRG
ncbi:MAG: IclR family transcriptional regulator [Burkholderiaceae bacterium]